MDVAQLDTIAILASTIDGGCMTLSIRDWAIHDKSRPRVVGRIAHGADLLVRPGKLNRRHDQVSSVRAELQNKTWARRVKGTVHAIGDSVGWVWARTLQRGVVLST